MKRIALAVSMLLCMVVPGLSAQGPQKIDPLFPAETPGLIYLEGEDAVSTNFAPRPTLDYSSSGMRILQLNQGPQSPGAPFFAEYVFLVDDPGDYELWLGGTPLGPKDALLPSLSSPISEQLDDQPPTAVYREDTNVVSHYSLTNYWSRLKVPLKLTKGTHTLRFVVSEKRRYDNNYYFFLDAFFLLKNGAVLPPAEALPAAFPPNRNDRSLDQYFLSVAQYEALIQANPKVLANYLQLAMVYSIGGDFQNALKVLSRAKVNTPADPKVTLLLAKNRIWSGEWKEGLDLYKDYLKAVPDDLGAWAEVAKSLAWLGQYPASTAIYLEGLKNFPDDLNLRVNLGLTYLWANRIGEGEAQLAQAWSQAKLSDTKVKLLGEIYQTNGFPTKATETYQQAISLFPGFLEFYLLLEESLIQQGKVDDAKATDQRILETFAPSERLQALLDGFQRKEHLKQATLDGYQVRLADHPNDLNLREALVQAYFWNGSGLLAIQETKNILVNKLYLQFAVLKKDLDPTYRVMDRTYTARAALRTLEKRQAELTVALKAALSQWQTAAATKNKPAKPELEAAAQDALAAQTARVEAFAAVLVQVREHLDALVAQADPEIQKIPAETKTLNACRPWIWDREATMKELAEASQAGVSLADFLLGRLALDEQNLTLASVYSAKFPELQTQGELWRSAEADPAALGFPPLPEAPDPVFADTTPARAADLLKDLAAYPAVASGQRATLNKTLSQLHQRVMVRTQIQFYQNEVDTFDLRYQLASYLLDENQFQQARSQLERVLVLEPGNIPTKFNLGRARQLSGDWSGAMQLYREVYQTDPQFESTAASYNQLAKLHEDQLSTRFTTLVDNARNTTQGRLDYRLQGSSWLGLDASYRMDTIRVYQQSNSVVAGSAFLQTAELAPTLTLPDLNLNFTARVGGVWQNTLMNSLIPTTQSVLPGDVATKFSAVSPRWGAGAAWSFGPLELTGAYSFDQLQDTFLASLNPANVLLSRTVFFEHKAEATANLYFAFPAPLVLRGVGTRTYFQFAAVSSPFVPATNRLYSALQEVDLTFFVAETPATTATLFGTATFDNTDNPNETNYYVPNRVTTFKAGVQLGTRLPTGSGWVLGLSARAAAGNYTDAANADLLTESSVRIDLTSGELTFYLDGLETLSNNGSTVAYWSDQFVLGINLGLPNYIIK